MRPARRRPGRPGTDPEGPLTPAEWRRKAVHAGFGLFALSLRWLDWRAAAVCALAALLFNVYAMPRFGRGLFRPGVRRHDPGIVAYPAMVLLLVLVFRGPYLPVAAAVWAMMAFGDPAAAIAGRSVGGPVLPWNRAKTWVGLLANWAVAGPASILVFLFVSRREPHADAVAILMIGAGVYAFLESVESGLDDNVVAALPTALVIYQLGMSWPPRLLPGGAAWTWVGLALAVNLAAAVAMGALSVVRRSGAVAGGVAGFLILGFGGWRAYALLWAFFLLGTLATRLGYRRKAAAGLAQEDYGRRGAAHVVANVIVPAVLVLLHAPAICLVAAFGAALADTLATEVGTLYGRRAFSPLTFQPLAPGTPGAVSWAGTAASLAGAAALAAVAWQLGLLARSILWAAVLGGFFGALSESLVNDLGRRMGFRLDHEFANAANTFVGAMVALRLASGGSA
jgi:uncharacterized protein (TIGR00297 family)